MLLSTTCRLVWSLSKATKQLVHLTCDTQFELMNGVTICYNDIMVNFGR